MAKRLLFVLGIMVFLLISFVNAESFSPQAQRYIETGQNAEWFYTAVHKADGTTEYIGINKVSRGEMGFADENEFFGKMWLVPAFQHPANSQWYLCPIKDIETVNSFSDLENGWYFDLSDSALTCYQHQNPSISGGADMDIQLTFITDPTTANTKININVTVNSLSPSNTGFAFIFFPENPEKYRYVRMDGNIYDLAGVEGQLPADKVFEFLDDEQNEMGHIFDWTDMIDFGNRYAEILTIGGQKALMVGTYGYGATNFISIDPIYQVDYSPTPATWLIDGEPETDPESSFADLIDVTTNMSDNNSATTVTISQASAIEELFSEYWEDQNWGSWDRSCSGSQCFLNTQIEFTTTAIEGNISVRMEGRGDGGSYQTLILNYTLPTTDYENISVEYARYCQGREPDEPFNFSTSYNGGSSFEQKESFLGSSSLSTKQFNLSSNYDDISNMMIKFETYQNYDNDECYIDEIVVYGYDEDGVKKALSGRFSETYDGAYNWFFGLTKETASSIPVKIFAYDNSDDISTEYVTDTLIGTGDFWINVSGLTDYMTNNQSLSYSAFRVVSDVELEISQIAFRKEANDTQAPLISDCAVDDSTPVCLDTFTFSCNVTDDVAVDSVTFTINSQNYTATKIDSIYSYTFDINLNGTLNYTLTDVYATDVSSNENTSTPNVLSTYECIFEDYLNLTHDSDVDVTSISNVSATITWLTSNLADSRIDYGLAPDNLSYFGYDPILKTTHSVILYELQPNTTYYYNLTSSINPNQTEGVYNFTTAELLCTPDWTQVLGICQINDSRLISYYDSNYCGVATGIPLDNGTYFACNYCTEDLQSNVGTCLWNGTAYTEEVTWQDNNYFTCCVITTIGSDCSITTYPYNESSIQICNEFTQDFDVAIDDVVYFGFDIGGKDKVYGKVYINDTTEYSCISYVKTPEGKLIQSNPVYEQKTSSMITISGSTYEDRAVFSTTNGLTNVYWTKENVVVDGTLYVFGVECSNGSEHKISEKAVNVFFENVDDPITRWFWFKDNTVPIILGLLLVTIIVIFVGMFIRELRRR